MSRLTMVLSLSALVASIGCPTPPAPDAGAGDDVGGLPVLDGGDPPGDAGAPSDDGGAGDGGAPADDGGALACTPADLADVGDPDRDRVVLVGHPFGAEVGTNGTEIRSLTLKVGSDLADDGVRLDVGFEPARIELVPSGAFALVLGEAGELASVRVRSAADLAVVDQVTLPSAGYGDLRVSADGSEAFVVGSNVDGSSGVSVVRVACDGALDVVTEAFFPLRLSESLAFLPGEQRAVLLGGQTVFEPIDDDDVRLLQRSGEGFTEVGAFDLYGDFIDALRIAVSPDGGTLLIPNGSPFSNEGSQVLVATLDGDSITESHRIQGMDDAREALFSADGQTALVTLLEPGKVVVLSDQGAGLAVANEIAGVGLAEHMAQVERGQLAGTVLVTSVGQHGELTTLGITGPGVVEERDVLDLGAGGENLPGALAVMQ